MKKTNNIFVAFTMLLSVLFVLTLVIFTLNLSREGHQPISGLRSLGGAIAEENGKETMQMYKVNEQYAYFVDTNYISLGKFEKTGYPLSFACGAYQGAIGASVYAPRVNGDYAYQQNFDETAWNILTISTGELTEVQKLSDFTQANLDPEAEEVTAEWIAEQGYKKLAYQKESCVTITLAEIILLGASLLGSGIVALVEYKKAKKLTQKN